MGLKANCLPQLQSVNASNPRALCVPTLLFTWHHLSHAQNKTPLFPGQASSLLSSRRQEEPIDLLNVSLIPLCPLSSILLDLIISLTLTGQ